MRELDKNPDLYIFAPQKMSVKKAKSMYKTQADVRLLINSVDRLFKRGALTPVITSAGAFTTKYQLHEIELGIKRINSARARIAKKIDVSPYRGTMGTIEANNLAPKKTDPLNVKQRHWDKFVASVEKQSRHSYHQEGMEGYKLAYIQACKDNLGRYAADIIAIVKHIPAEEFFYLSMNDPILHISFTSDPIPHNEIRDLVVAQLNAYGYYA